MKHFKTVTETRQRLDYVTCDKCGAGADTCESYGVYDPHWFSFRDGKRYPEGGEWKTYEMDLCKNCALTLIVLLKRFAYQIREEDSETW
jgi:hypothetical protein